MAQEERQEEGTPALLNARHLARAPRHGQFAQSKAQSDREQQESERRRQDAEREAAAKRRQKEEHEKARIERERAAARAANEDGDGIDMLGQSNMMASFADGSGTFDFSGLDEYGDD